MPKSNVKRAIKYLGDSDNRVIAVGETWGGRLAEPLDVELRWDWDNNHLLSVDQPQEVLDLLLQDPEFVDATGLKVVPAAAVEARRLGIATGVPDLGALSASGIGGVAPEGSQAGASKTDSSDDDE